MIDIIKSLEYFIKKQNDIPELIAKYIDYQLQTGARGTSGSESENTLDRTMDDI